MANKLTKDERKRKRRARRDRVVPILLNIAGLSLMLGVIILSVPLAIPRIMGYEIFDVVSGSMDPAIPMDSVVYVQQVDPAEVQVDDVIAFYREDDLVVHRVVANSTLMGEFDTKGDANEEKDPDPVPYDMLIGRVALHIPLLGKVMALYASDVGRIYLVMALACGVMLNFLAVYKRADARARIKYDLAKKNMEAARNNATAEELEAMGEELKKLDPEERKHRRIRRLRTAAIVLLLVVFVGSAAVVAFVTMQRNQSDRIYNDTAHQFTVEAGEDDNGTIAPKTVDFDKLCAINPDVVGWIYCPDSNIDYPVLHGKTNDEYLRTDYTHEYNINGSIFVDCNNTKGFVDANTIIYGHHMNHGAMFATLEEWADQKFYEKHSVMWLLTPTQDYQVVLVSGHHTSAYSDMYDIYQEHDEAFAKFLNEAVEESDFKPVDDATVNPDRNYIMLSTCAYIFDNARYVLHGKLVPVDSAGGVPLQR